MMKKLIYIMFFLSALLLCSYDPVVEPQTGYKPILLTREQLEGSVVSASPTPMMNPGKIYIKGRYVYIVEKYRGIHVIDNYDRKNPVKKQFIKIPGCIDVAIKNNTLYADNAVDLVAIDISDLSNVKVTKRIKEAFPEVIPPDYDYLPYEYTKDNRPNNTVIVDWEEKQP